MRCRGILMQGNHTPRGALCTKVCVELPLIQKRTSAFISATPLVTIIVVCYTQNTLATCGGARTHRQWCSMLCFSHTILSHLHIHTSSTTHQLWPTWIYCTLLQDAIGSITPWIGVASTLHTVSSPMLPTTTYSYTMCRCA